MNPTRTPKAVVFLFPGTNSNAGNITCDAFLANTLASIERHKNDPALKSHATALKDELPSANERLIARYLAANGYDVYAIDYRTHFVPMDTPPKELGFMKDWGWELFIADAKAAIDQAKAISGQPKVFLGGTSFGGMLAMNYAALYWKDDLKGLILLDGGNGGKWRIRIPLEVWKLVKSELLTNLPELPENSFVDGELTPAFLQALIDVLGKTLIYKEMYALDLSAPEGSQGELMNAFSGILGALGVPLSINTAPHFASVRPAAFKDVLAKPIDPVTGAYLKPFDPETGQPFPTYLDWNAELTASLPLPGLFSNLHGGYNSGLGLALNQISGDRYWPLEIYLEAPGMFEFELTSSDEPIGLLGVQLDPSGIPEAVRRALSVLTAPARATKAQSGEIGQAFGGASGLAERLGESLASLQADYVPKLL